MDDIKARVSFDGVGGDAMDDAVEFVAMRGPQKAKDPLDEIRQDLKDIKNILMALSGAVKPRIEVKPPENLKFFRPRA